MGRPFELRRLCQECGRVHQGPGSIEQRFIQLGFSQRACEEGRCPGPQAKDLAQAVGL
jgi:hypothetical protein